LSPAQAPSAAEKRVEESRVIQYSFESLDEVGTRYLVNPVNVVGVMGSGVARWFRQAYPEMYRVYRDLCQRQELRIGNVLVWHTEDHSILNLPTKRHWAEPSRLDDVEVGLRIVRDFFDRSYAFTPLTHNIAMPRIGCGLGGLRWDTQVAPLVAEILDGWEVTVCDGRLRERGPVPSKGVGWDLWE
jgi:O-acetyl-ADP-ribose deacetylase (regulator of RNase III)